MRKLMYIKNLKKNEMPTRFAFLPTFVVEVHPTHDKKWLIWLEFYNIGSSEKFLLCNS